VDCGVPRFSRDGVFLGYVGCCVDINDFCDKRRSQ